jgi:phage/plasmid-like protein (TIGR03299 family)
MSANVKQMFSVREVPWHREGEVVAEYPGSWAEARKLAGLDWNPVKQAVYKLVGIDPTGQPIYEQIPGFQEIARSDNMQTIFVTQDSYPLITHDDFGEIFEAVLQTNKDSMKVETGGVLEDSRKVWMLVSLKETFKVKGDKSPHQPFVAITARHDARGAVTARATAIRIVCANTFRASEMEGERTGYTYSFPHRGKEGSWRNRLDDAREAVMGIRKEIREYIDMMEGLYGIKVTPAQTEAFLTAFIPAPPKGLTTDRVAKNIDEARQSIRTILTSPTIDGSGIAGTVGGLVQAAGEYADHVRRAQSWETKINRTIIRPEPLKARALTMAMEAAKA